MARPPAPAFALALAFALSPARLLAAGAGVPAAPPARVEQAAPLPTRAQCRAEKAWRCTAGGCEAADEGLQAEHFELDVKARTLGACLYTDCFSGKAALAREPERPWLVTAVGVVRSARPRGGVPPPGSAPFPLTVSVDLRTGRFTATWAHGPEGLQVDHGACELGRGR
jgi:hypothetical protein